MHEPFSLRSSLPTIFFGVFGGAILGGLFGVGLGALAPDYYRGVFPNGNAPSFDPVSVGLGLGTTQGALAGAALAAILLGRRSFVRVGRQEASISQPRVWPLWLAMGALSVVIAIPRLVGDTAPQLAWKGEKLRIWNFGLHDLTVTHFVSGSLTASLPQPALLRSHDEDFAVDPKRLSWQDSSGTIHSAPVSGDPVQAIYSEARRSPVATAPR